MHPTTIALFLAGTAAVAGSPIAPANLTRGQLSACESKMDSKLPYYQPLGFNFSGNVRRYYVATEVSTWNYAPSGECFLSVWP